MSTVLCGPRSGQASRGVYTCAPARMKGLPFGPTSSFLLLCAAFGPAGWDVRAERFLAIATLRALRRFGQVVKTGLAIGVSM
ncbi:hypothetical protein GCM10009706_21350 [Curtobacterium citreum]|nr:hypothetical protein GCM10009706_21350 [Curtobacterium citreum]